MDVWDAIDRLPRARLGHYPTPLLPAKRLPSTLGGPELWFKRDDLISFGLGGNKIRGLEFLVADAVAKGADTLVTGAGPQSNHVRAAAAAASSQGLQCTVVLWGDPPMDCNGNYRLTKMFGVDVIFTGDPERASVDRGIEEAADGLRHAGKRPYSIPRGGACALGALGHTFAAGELYEQCKAIELEPDAIVLATGSGGTHAGWLLGSRALNAGWAIESFTVSRKPEKASTEVVRLATEAASLVGKDWTFAAQDAPVHGGFIGEGYGIPTPEATDAIKRVSRAEGILLDPTYTGKAMAGYLHRLSRGFYRAYRNIVFLHTGGEPTFFAGDGSWLW